MTVSRSAYELLGVVETADLQNIKKAFHRLSKLLHPDTTLLPVDEAASQFRQICEAYEVLSDPIKREAYDKTLEKRNWIIDQDPEQLEIFSSSSAKSIVTDGNRRPFSGGELFSLLLLCIALCISLLLAIMFAVLDGKELQVRPSWLQTNQSNVNSTTTQFINDVNSTSS